MQVADLFLCSAVQPFCHLQISRKDLNAAVTKAGRCTKNALVLVHRVPFMVKVLSHVHSKLIKTEARQKDVTGLHLQS